MKRFFLVSGLILSCVFNSFGVASAQVVVPQHAEKFVEYPLQKNEFAAAIVIDMTSGKVLYEYEADKKWSAASLTKLMGALVFLEHHPLWNTIVSLKAQDEVGGGRLRVPVGATLTVLDLLYSSITASANNAATAMARVSGLGVKGFVKAMNDKAKKLGLLNTTFVDPSGMDPKNVTTARDMARLAATAYNAETIRRSATTSLYRFRIRNTGEVKEIKNTNALLTQSAYDDLYVTGGKTGFLHESMYNLAVRLKPTGVAGTKKNLMIVVFGAPTSEDSFKSAARLANWAWKMYRWQP